MLATLATPEQRVVLYAATKTKTETEGSNKTFIF
jgi:hypothetical protein